MEQKENLSIENFNHNLQDFDWNIKYDCGYIDTTNLNQGKELVKKVSEYLDTIEVTEDNIKACKKLVARVRKAALELDDNRKLVRKRLLTPYDNFAKQVKEILNISKEAEDRIRADIFKIEEKRRQVKKAEIKDIFDKRLKHYDFDEKVSFDQFFKDKYLNKSESMTKIEKEMVDWLENVKQSTDAIKSLASGNNVLDVNELLDEYYKHFNFERVQNHMVATLASQLTFEGCENAEMIEQYTILEIPSSQEELVINFLNDNKVDFKISHKIIK